MEKKFRGVVAIKNMEVYEEMKEYASDLISYATRVGELSDPGKANVYTVEICRVCRLCADYENDNIKFEHLRVKNPLILAIEKFMEREKIKELAMANLLNSSAYVFTQVMLGRRPMTLPMARRLYQKTGIDPKIILEYG